jgi:hypothetical protein
MSKWMTYWEGAMAEYREADRIYGPGCADDNASYWPGREEGMQEAFMKGASRHIETLGSGAFPGHELELSILIEIGVARAGLRLPDLNDQMQGLVQSSKTAGEIQNLLKTVFQRGDTERAKAELANASLSL